MSIQSDRYYKDYSSLIKRVLNKVVPKRATSSSTMYDVGYEAAKADIAEIIMLELGENNKSPIHNAVAKL